MPRPNRVSQLIPFVGHRCRHRRTRSAGRLLQLEILEDRRLLAVTILEESFKTLPLNVINGHYSGQFEKDVSGFLYKDQFQGATTSITGTITYTSPTHGEGDFSFSGNGQGSDNASCAGGYTYTFSGNATKFVEDNGALGDFDVQLTDYQNIGCSGGIPMAFKQGVTGTFNTSDFSSTVSWSLNVEGGTASGNWNGQVVFPGEPFDAKPIGAIKDGDSVMVEYAITGKPAVATSHTTPVTDVQLFWATGPTLGDVLGNRLADPIPIYWNQAGGRALVSELPVQPPAATHLLVVTDYTNSIMEGNEGNNVLALGTDIELSTVSWNTDRDTDPTKRGLDVGYSVLEGKLTADTVIAFYWADGTTFADRLGAARNTVPVEVNPGTYTINESAIWGKPPVGATHVLVVADPAGLVDEQYEDNNVLALPFHTPAQLLSGAIVFGANPLDGTDPILTAQFKPGGELTLSEAEVALGVHHFNWVQHVTTLPDGWWLHTQERRYYGMHELTLPQLDPPVELGNQNQVYVATDPDQQLANLPVDDAPFYFDEGGEVGSKMGPWALHYGDAPRSPDNLVVPGDFLAYRTSLVGVDATGQLVPLVVDGTATSFAWKTDAVYDHGETGNHTPIWLKAVDDQTLPQVISGGVFDLAMLDSAPPTAHADFVTLRESTEVDIDVLANDIDADGVLDPSSITISFAPDHGTAEVDSSTGKIIYTAADDYIGFTTFGYSVSSDDGAVSNVTDVTVRITSNHGFAKHAFTAKVSTVNDTLNVLGGLNVDDVISGTLVYDTSMPNTMRAVGDARLDMKVGDTEFPPVDYAIAKVFADQGNVVYLSVAREYSQQYELAATFFFEGTVDADRLPESLEGFQGELAYFATDEDGNEPFGFVAAIQTLTSIPVPPWQNAINPLNVNRSGEEAPVQPLDALLLINSINQVGSRELPETVDPSNPPPPYFDVNGDGWLAPNDVLAIINYLNNRVSRASGEGEDLVRAEMGNPSLHVAARAFSVAMHAFPFESGREPFSHHNLVPTQRARHPERVSTRATDDGLLHYLADPRHPWEHTRWNEREHSANETRLPKEETVIDSLLDDILIEFNE